MVALFFLAAAIPAGDYAGSAACKTCHAAQFDSQSAAPHAHALSKSSDPKYQWAFGAPVQATTYVSQFDADNYIEHHLTFYTRTKSLAPTPGHQGQKGPGVLYRLFSPGSEILRCFQCHSTGPLQITGKRAIQPFEPGVRCEVCHGPAAAHARQPSRSNVQNPNKWTAAEINQFCGSCHRKPGPAGGQTDFRDAWNVRHQPLYLDQARCFRESGGKLSCLTCHPPHGGAAKAVCRNCHATPRHSPQTLASKGTCVFCHMPVVRPQPELGFANHWIGIFSSSQALVPLRSPLRYRVNR